MKCRLCGAKVQRKNGHCTQCGARIMRNPNQMRKRMFRVFLVTVVAVLLFGVFLILLQIYDKTHQGKALLPGLYTGMTKLEMIRTLKDDYPAFYNGKQMNSENVPDNAAPMTFVAYSEYSNTLGLNRAMELEVHFFVSGGEYYVHSYTLSIPYITEMSETGAVDKVTVHDIQTKILPSLTSLYGESEHAEGAIDYITHFNIKESVCAEQCKVSDLLGYQDALLTTFKSYTGNSTCIRITYEGFCSKLFWHSLF